MIHCACVMLMDATPVLSQIQSEAPNFSGKPCIPSDPHSNAVVDLNGDCLAGKPTFCLRQIFTLIKHVKISSSCVMMATAESRTRSGSTTRMPDSHLDRRASYLQVYNLSLLLIWVSKIAAF